MSEIVSRIARLSGDPQAFSAFCADGASYLGVTDGTAPFLRKLGRDIGGPTPSAASVMFRRSRTRHSCPRTALPEVEVKPCDALLVVPPFCVVDQPSLGAHLLQASARARGFDVRVLYANVLLAERLGVDDYELIAHSGGGPMLGERFFVREAYDRDAPLTGRNGRHPAQPLLLEASSWTASWIEAIARGIAAARIPIVGCSTMFEQTSASIAILRAVKRLAPATITILGGANCAGPMASGVAGLSGAVDYVFSGDADATFPEFLENIRKGDRPHSRVITAPPFRDLERIPTPDFADYYDQLARIEGDDGISRNDVWLPYEASRGCWWGEKQHCTFCGLNGEGMVFSEKSPERVIDDLRQLTTQHPGARICLVDNIMPHRYFKSLLPRLQTEIPGITMFAEQKSNLTLEKTRLLREAGMATIQPGIESLSTPLLRHMKKGVTGPQNVALLRYARALDLPLYWHVLYGFPGDVIEWYEEMARLVPLIGHLHAPTGLTEVVIERFSPYYERAASFGVSNVRPASSYREVLPESADHDRVAYSFDADFASGSKNGAPAMRELREHVERWQERWRGNAPAPVLSIAPLSDDQFVLADTRNAPRFEVIDRAKAHAALVATEKTSALEWAVSVGAATTADGAPIALATAHPDVLAAFDA